MLFIKEAKKWVDPFNKLFVIKILSQQSGTHEIYNKQCISNNSLMGRNGSMDKTLNESVNMLSNGNYWILKQFECII